MAPPRRTAQTWTSKLHATHQSSQQGRTKSRPKIPNCTWAIWPKDCWNARSFASSGASECKHCVWKIWMLSPLAVGEAMHIFFSAWKPKIIVGDKSIFVISAQAQTWFTNGNHDQHGIFFGPKRLMASMHVAHVFLQASTVAMLGRPSKGRLATSTHKHIITCRNGLAAAPGFYWIVALLFWDQRVTKPFASFAPHNWHKARLQELHRHNPTHTAGRGWHWDTLKTHVSWQGSAPST